jgi:L-glyceraldehyde 3-phosphate reductase
MGAPCLIHQMRYNLLERAAEGELLQALADEGIGGIAFSPLAQGLLTDRYLGGDIPADSRAAGRVGFLRAEHITAERVRLIGELDGFARARGQSLAQLALSWVLRHPVMSSVLIGASRPSQVRDAVGALRSPAFTDQELAAIEGLLAKE